MDLDAFVTARRPVWDRLDQLVAQRSLLGAEADELISLYRQTAHDMSRVSANCPDPAVLHELSIRLMHARGRISGTKKTHFSEVKRFFTTVLPISLYRVRWMSLWVTIVSLLVALIVGVWTYRSPEAMAQLGTPKRLQTLAEQDFASYYSTYAPYDFAAQVWTNNARIAAILVASGITGYFPVQILWQNSVHLGQMGAILADHDLLGTFFLYIAPHGLIELSCVFIAGGAGLHLLWSFLVPGRRPRIQALAEEGRIVLSVVVALTTGLFVAGLLEGFITPSSLPWALKILIGALACIGLWWTMWVVGAQRAHEGQSADLEEVDAGYSGIYV
ncbi:stage II sporulation protein M [Actinomyces vulturis]|uniref:stage II sporulation protein M n=1 Tax=Actinomyces vulturis TaxID=1857645 RepID=UPI00082F23E2|nr:stage II sporulation protein M [Actinomyces vulturis]